MQLSALSAPEVVRSYVDDSFRPRLPIFCLRWEAEGNTERLWELPEGVTVLGPAPTRFGLSVQRLDSGSYAVRLLWDRTYLSWAALSRAELLTCCLSTVLSALGKDLWHLLDQPQAPAARGRFRAA
jgi:hypothetical protein